MYGMTPGPEDTDSLSVLQVLARTAWGEARGLLKPGMQATINTVQNRFKSRILWWGHDFRSICLAPLQYDCWLPADPNRAKLLAVTESDPQFICALDIAQRAIDGTLEDLTSGSDSYFDTRLPRDLWPKWASEPPLFKCGSQRYYKVR